MLLVCIVPDEARQKKSGVLVHCLAGISRSVTVTVAYLMQTQRLSLNDAYDYVKSCKPNISPNFNFMGQLLDFEQKLLQQDCSCGGEATTNGGPQNSKNDLRVCACVNNKETKTFFSSPTCKSSSVSSTSSLSSSSSLAASSASSSTAFDYDIPPTPPWWGRAKPLFVIYRPMCLWWIIVSQARPTSWYRGAC